MSNPCNPNLCWPLISFSPRYYLQAKKQHEQRCIDFLTKELEVCTYNEALERVFFVSAKEMLEFRTNETGTTRNSDQKILDRHESFLDFERSLQKNLCVSALKTKFSSHSLQGLQLIENMLSIIKRIFDQISDHLMEINERKLVIGVTNQNVKNRLSKTNEVVVHEISKVMENIRNKVVESLQLEIKHLNTVVKNFSSPFDPDPSHLLVYKTELNNFVENEINHRISSFCSVAVKTEMVKFKKFIIDEYTKLIGYEIDKSVLDIFDRTTVHELTIPCNSLFSNFKENLSFQWPFSPQSLFSNIFMMTYAARNQISMNYAETDSQSLTSRFGSLRPVASQIGETFLNKELIGFCFISALIYKVTGFKVITSAICSYGILYLFERIRWSRQMQERNFKNQYVKYASGQLTSLIDICTRSYSSVIKEDLHMNHKSLARFVDNELSRGDHEIRKYESEMNYLGDHLRTAGSLKAEAGEIQKNLLKFIELYL